MDLFIVTGLSGSGKSIALQALEDMGFYCIDNLPGALLPQYINEISNSQSTEYKKSAVGIDARNRSFLNTLPECFSQLESLGISFKIIFLEADIAVLVKRFKETRRRHPLIDKDTSLLEGIALEKKLLEPLSIKATLRIDTTHTTTHELRQKVFNFIGAAQTEGITLQFESFGFKHGTPLDADYVFDIRCLPNPYWQTELRQYNGKDEQIVNFMDSYEEVAEMFEGIKSFLEKWLPFFIRENRSYMTIAVGCTGGQHRSVYFAEKLAKHFSTNGQKTITRHRELS